MSVAPMEHRDPYALIERTAAALRRRRLANALLPWLAPGAVLGGFAALDRLPVGLAAAGAILGAVLLLWAANPGPGRRHAASRLDAKTGGRDHFLTLATGRLEPPLGPLVEAGAARLGEGLRPADVLPPLAWRRFALGAAGAALLAALLALAPASLPPAPGPAERLEAVAEKLARAGGEAAIELSRELRETAAALRDPEASPEEKRQAIERALEKLEEQEKGSGSEGGGGADGSEQASGSEALRGEARSALEQASGTGNETASGESSGERRGESEPDGAAEGEGAPRGESGGGLDAPRPEPSGAKERDGESEGGENRPDDSPAKSAESKGGAGEGREPRDPERPGPGEARGPDPTGGTASGGTAPSPSTSEGAENPDLPGDGTGWRIVDGRYVRVRVPEGENDALETERVRGPGEVEPVTPYANAPLPGEGPTGDPVERQPVPLEYRNVLGGGDSP